jgi:hypothetical protein
MIYGSFVVGVGSTLTELQLALEQAVAGGIPRASHLVGVTVTDDGTEFVYEWRAV